MVCITMENTIVIGLKNLIALSWMMFIFQFYIFCSCIRLLFVRHFLCDDNPHISYLWTCSNRFINILNHVR